MAAGGENAGSRPRRAGVVGAGTMGAIHAAVWREAASVQLAGIYDPNRDAASALAARHGSPSATTLERLLDEVDIVSICTPPNGHLAVVQAAAERGVHALLEKPSARTLAEHDEIAAVVAKAGTVCMVGTTSRFYPESRDAFTHLRNHPGGTLLAVRERVHLDNGTLPAWYLDPDVAGGGVLLTNGIHAIDRILWLTGSERLTIVAARLRPTPRRETFADVSGRLDDGTPVHLQFVWQPGASGCSQLELVRERDTIEVATWDRLRIYGDHHDERSYYAAADDFVARTAVGIAAEVHELLAALAAPRRVESDLAEHRRALAAIDDAYELVRRAAHPTDSGEAA